MIDRKAARVLGLLSLSFLAPAQAQDMTAPNGPPLMMVGGGTWETLRKNFISPEVDVAYRSDQPCFWIIKPHMGVLASKDGSYYGWLGLYADLHLTDHFVASPSTAFGGWGGGGYNLGSHLEFRSGMDVAYKFDGGTRIGVGFYHASNAGITRENGGSESLLLEFSVPVKRLF